MLSKNKEIAVKKDFKFQFLVGDLNKKVQVRYFSILAKFETLYLYKHTLLPADTLLSIPGSSRHNSSKHLSQLSALVQPGEDAQSVFCLTEGTWN